MGGYCDVDRVKKRLYSGQQQTSTMPVDAGRDDLLQEIIEGLSREFDHETGRPPGAYDLTYESRLFSGQGSQLLKVDEFAVLSKIEYNTTIFGTPTWNDVTTEIANGRIAVRPIRFWPKRQLFRLNTWIVDPYENGNARMTGIWGVVQPIKGVPQPAVSVQSPWFGLTVQADVQALAPDPTLTTGWWQTPVEVQKAIATWTVYKFKSGQAGYGDTGGRQGGAGALFTKGIPPNVQRVIDKYKGGSLKLALIGLDGYDPTDPTSEGGDVMERARTRWAGWQTFDPITGQSN
jgi:hypothetical protein